MKRWLKRIRGAVGMGLVWAAGWAVAGVLIGVTSVLLPGLPWGSFFKVFDAPLPAMAVPGFVGGVFFSIVLGIAGHRRRFRELSLPRFAAWGAVGGLLLILFPFALVAVGLASREGSDTGAWQIIAVAGVPFILLSAVSAAGSLALARRAEQPELLGPHESLAGIGLAESNARELLAGGDSSFQRSLTADRGERARSDPGDASRGR
jgi:hypothetical protein